MPGISAASEEEDPGSMPGISATSEEDDPGSTPGICDGAATEEEQVPYPGSVTRFVICKERKSAVKKKVCLIDMIVVFAFGRQQSCLPKA
jgi:hypothetical protein